MLWTHQKLKISVHLWGTVKVCRSARKSLKVQVLENTIYIASALHNWSTIVSIRNEWINQSSEMVASAKSKNSPPQRLLFCSNYGHLPNKIQLKLQGSQATETSTTPAMLRTFYTTGQHEINKFSQVIEAFISQKANIMIGRGAGLAC